MRAKIADPLLIIHGMSDDNVVLDNIDRVGREDAGSRSVPFEMMLYPGKTHASAGRGSACICGRRSSTSSTGTVTTKP